jgi:ABC-2 type transport system permease protein
MNMTLNAVRAGLVRGRIECKQLLTNTEDLMGIIIPNAIFLVVMIFMRGSKVPGTNFSLGSTVVPGVLGMGIVFSGLVGIAASLTIDREDGTLLRAKATPHGMTGYLVGKVVASSGTTVVGLLITLVPSLFLFDGLASGGLVSWVMLIVVLVLGLLASMPIGAVVGSLTTSSRSMGLIMLPFVGLTAISGVFYPITALPGWLQWIGEMFPIYWTGIGMRSALLPDALSAVEIGGSWRHLETLGVLGIWAVLGFVLAPAVLRRMARRESGSAVAARREKVMQQVR